MKSPAAAGSKPGWTKPYCHAFNWGCEGIGLPFTTHPKGRGTATELIKTGGWWLLRFREGRAGVLEWRVCCQTAV